MSDVLNVFLLSLSLLITKEPLGLLLKKLNCYVADFIASFLDAHMCGVACPNVLSLFIDMNCPIQNSL